MIYTIAQIEWCGFRVNGIEPDHVIRTRPDHLYPHGRKGQGMQDWYAQVRDRGHHGIVWLDADVAADPDDLAAIDDAIIKRPDYMHTAALKLWPASTGRDDWMWSHRTGDHGSPEATQDISAPVRYVATGMLYTPMKLLSLCYGPLARLQWAEVDVFLSEMALRHDIPARIVLGCRPKHLHF